MFALLDEWKLLAGLGMFLFGIFVMEESMKLLSGRTFKIMIRRYTGSRLKGLITGIISTSILQSSSAVSLLVLAFMGAGLMTLGNAIAVIIGAKIGTTVTAWIVAVFGFKFKIEAFALPMIGIGGVGLILLPKSTRYVNVSKLITAFGLLFYGLDFMKTSMEALAASIDLTALPALGVWVYVAAGIVMTAIMQSSSATIAVILTTLFTGIIDFRAGAAMVIGANVGTTVTILLGAVGGIPAKKRAAFSSLLFSVGTAMVVLLALPLILWLVHDFFDLPGNAVLGVALFHTLFNVTGAVIFFPLISTTARRLEKLFPEKRTILAKYILNTSPQVPEAAIVALRKEVLHQLFLSLHYIASRYRIDSPQSLGVAGNRSVTPKVTEDAPPYIGYFDLERLHAEIFAFYAKVQAQEVEEAETAQMDQIIRSSRSIMNSTKNLYELMDEIEDIGNEDKLFLVDAYQGFKKRLEHLCLIVDIVTKNPDDLRMDERLKRFFNDVEDADKAFIRSRSREVANGTLKEQEVTRLLMVNRLFTQSSRMLVLSTQGLIHHRDDAQQPNPHDPVAEAP